MANKIFLKKSSVAGKIPAAEDLEYGELALNYTDGNLFYKSNANVVTTLISTQSVSVTGNVTGGNISTTGTVTANVGSFTTITGDGSGLSNLAAFSNISVANGNSVTANATSNTVTFSAGEGIAITADSGVISISLLGGGDGPFLSDNDFGLVSDAATVESDLGSVAESITAEVDLGTLVTGGLIYPEQLLLPNYTVSTLPAPSLSGLMIYVSDESGGGIPAFSDGNNWRRVSDRQIIS